MFRWKVENQPWIQQIRHFAHFVFNVLSATLCATIGSVFAIFCGTCVVNGGEGFQNQLMSRFFASSSENLLLSVAEMKNDKHPMIVLFERHFLIINQYCSNCSKVQYQYFINIREIVVFVILFKFQKKCYRIQSLFSSCVLAVLKSYNSYVYDLYDLYLLPSIYGTGQIL